MGKRGRPKLVTPEIKEKIKRLYKLGYGYRAVATILRKEDGFDCSYITVKRSVDEK